MNRSAFETAIHGMSWKSIEDLAEIAMNSEEIVTEEDRDEAVMRSTKSAIRQYMKSATDESGEPMYHSISQVQPDGSTTRVYKQEGLFDGSDYQQVVDYHVDRAKYNLERAVHMKERGEARGYEPNIPAAFEQLLMQV